MVSEPSLGGVGEVLQCDVDPLTGSSSNLHRTSSARQFTVTVEIAGDVVDVRGGRRCVHESVTALSCLEAEDFGGERKEG